MENDGEIKSPDEEESKERSTEEEKEQVPSELMELVPEDIREKFGDETGELIRALSIAEYFSGPLPHPRTLAQYKEVMPEAPQIIFDMAVKQQAHRMHIEKTVMEGGERRSTLGLALGFGTFILLGIGGIYLLAIGVQLGGVVVFFTTLGAAVVNLVREVSGRKKELEQKEGGSKFEVPERQKEDSRKEDVKREDKKKEDKKKKKKKKKKAED